MITEPFESNESEAMDEQRLTVSLNLWFTPMHRMLQPSLPLSPMLRVELARQLEFLISDALDDRPSLVVTFCAALARFVDGTAGESCEGSPAEGLYAGLRAGAPEGVDPAAWVGLLEYAAVKLAHLLGARQVRPFVHDLLSPVRFAELARKR